MWKHLSCGTDCQHSPGLKYVLLASRTVCLYLFLYCILIATRNAYASDLVTVRKRLEDIVKNNGGEYRGDLSKEVTHLIAFKPAGKKYEFAKTWDIRVVSTEWLQQSLERGMILDESLFDPHLEPGRRGENAWVRRTVLTSVLSKRSREDDNVAAPARKLRRTASAKGSIQQDGIWTDIVGGGPAGNDRKQNEWDEYQREFVTGKAYKKSNACLKTSALTGDEERPTEIMPTEPSKPPETGIEDDIPAERGLFFAKRFFLHGFDARKVRKLSIYERKLQLILSSIDRGYRTSSAVTRCRNLTRSKPVRSAICASQGELFICPGSAYVLRTWHTIHS